MSEGEVYKMSAHRLNTFLSCPLKLHMYLERYPIGETDKKYINLGNAVHGYIEDRMRNIINEPQFYFDKETVIAEFKEPFEACIEHAQEYLSLVGKAFPEKTVHKIFTTPKGRTVDLEARMDLVTDDTIYDWKTGNHLDTAEYRLQGMVYHFANDYRYKTVKFVQLRTGKTLDIPAPPESYIPNLCDKYIDAIIDKNYVKKESRLCDGFCDYARYCRGDLQFVYIGDVRADPEKYGVHVRQKT